MSSRDRENTRRMDFFNMAIAEGLARYREDLEGLLEAAKAEMSGSGLLNRKKTQLSKYVHRLEETIRAADEAAQRITSVTGAVPPCTEEEDFFIESNIT